MIALNGKDPDDGPFKSTSTALFNEKLAPKLSICSTCKPRDLFILFLPYPPNFMAAEAQQDTLKHGIQGAANGKYFTTFC